MIEDVAAYQPWPSFAAHCAAKAAQAMLTRVLARALAPEVRVCGVAPGPVAVEPEQEERRAAETALGRIGSPDDVADAILYLAGASFVTGHDDRRRRRPSAAIRGDRRCVERVHGSGVDNEPPDVLPCARRSRKHQRRDGP